MAIDIEILQHEEVLVLVVPLHIVDGGTHHPQAFRHEDGFDGTAVNALDMAFVRQILLIDGGTPVMEEGVFIRGILPDGKPALTPLRGRQTDGF